MAKKSPAKDQAPILACPCFNCGENIDFTYDPEKDNPLSGSRVHLKCHHCGVIGPGEALMITAVYRWNNLYYAMQAGNAYNALAGVSSPMEFAAWIKSIKDSAETILETKKEVERSKAFMDALKAVSDAAVETAKQLDQYTVGIDDFKQMAKNKGAWRETSVNHWAATANPKK